MSDWVDFAYLQTRLQSRHANLLADEQWRHVESFTELGPYIHALRKTTLENWVSAMHAEDSAELLERELRAHFLRYIEEIAVWHPRKWRESVLWVRVLLDLPVIQHLLDGKTAQAWMLEDARLRRFTQNEMPQRLQALSDSEYLPFLPAWKSGKSLVNTWRESWVGLWPDSHTGGRLDSTPTNDNATLHALADMLVRHLSDFRRLAVAQTHPFRSQLKLTLRFWFRRYSRQPVCTFIHLMLMSLELERLRGGLVHRSLFARTQIPPFHESGVAS